MSKPGTDTANLTIRDGIAFVELDKFPVNSLGTGLTYGRCTCSPHKQGL